MPNTTYYTHNNNGKKISCSHVECDPEFQKFSINPIDTGKTPTPEYQENEADYTPTVDNNNYGLYMWRFAIAGGIVALVLVIVTIAMVLK